MAAQISETMVDPVEDTIGFQLRRVALLSMSAMTDAFDEIGLKLSEGTIMRMVGANPGCNQSAIGRALGVKRTNMVPIVAELERRGLIRRVPVDGRSNALSLTEAGEAVHQQLSTVSADIEDRFFGEISPELRGAIVSLCRKIRGRLEP